MYFCTLGELNWITACNRERVIGLYLTFSYFPLFTARKLHHSTIFSLTLGLLIWSKPSYMPCSSVAVKQMPFLNARVKKFVIQHSCGMLSLSACVSLSGGKLHQELHTTDSPSCPRSTYPPTHPYFIALDFQGAPETNFR